jgi:uracil-DNA glycosylase family 4
MSVPSRRSTASELDRLARKIHTCRRCPRLVAWRERAAAEPPKRYEGERYWARPVSGFGDPAARLLVVGLAPAAHGGNRTGRIFTGDRSGDWLFAALHRAGYANQARSEHRGDGLRLQGAWIGAANRCPPPANRPTPEERDNCLPYLVRELELLDRVRVIVALGAFAWDGALRALRELGQPTPRPKPRFAHGAESAVGPYTLLGCFHPSQQNTFTGRLTEGMMERVFERAREVSETR